MESLRKELAKLHLYSHCNFQPSSDKEDFRYARLAPLHSLKTSVIIKVLHKVFGESIPASDDKKWTQTYHVRGTLLTTPAIPFGKYTSPPAGHKCLWHQPSLLGKLNHSLQQLPATKALTNDIAITQGADNREAIQDYDIKTSWETGKH